MESSIFKKIKSQLSGIEREENVRILYACESGSRAWGFESEDSDYDVRFIYLRKTSWYLTIQNRRDVIEKSINDELDVSGWDAPKALELFRKSNPPLLEWLQSPIIYVRESSFVERLGELMPQYYSPVSCHYHYFHMARKNLREYLKGDEVWTKKYFYVLRPVLACLWIEQGLGVVPTEFSRLVDGVVADTALRREIETLLEAKRGGAELDKGPRNPVISRFLEAELARLEDVAQPTAKTRDPEILDRLFHDILQEVNGPGIA